MKNVWQKNEHQTSFLKTQLMSPKNLLEGSFHFNNILKNNVFVTIDSLYGHHPCKVMIVCTKF